MSLQDAFNHGAKTILEGMLNPRQRCASCSALTNDLYASLCIACWSYENCMVDGSC